MILRRVIDIGRVTVIVLAIVIVLVPCPLSRVAFPWSLVPVRVLLMLK